MKLLSSLVNVRSDLAGLRSHGDILFSRIYGGFVPPIDNNMGHVILLGEQYTQRQKPFFYYLKEYKETTLDRLLEQMVIAKVEFDVDEYFYRPGAALNRNIDYWNSQRMEAKLSQVKVRQAPHAEEYKGKLEYYLHLLRQMSLSGRERVYLVGSNLPDVLGNVSPDEIRRMTDESNPRLGALCYALAALELTERERDLNDYGVTNLQHELHKLQNTDQGGPWRYARRR